VNKWEEFGRWCLEELRSDIGSNLDGGAAQDKAEELGLLERITVHEPCCDECNCAMYGEFPQECLRIVGQADRQQIGQRDGVAKAGGGIMTGDRFISECEVHLDYQHLCDWWKLPGSNSLYSWEYIEILVHGAAMLVPEYAVCVELFFLWEICEERAKLDRQEAWERYDSERPEKEEISHGPQ
jgi:hypothetical protein